MSSFPERDSDDSAKLDRIHSYLVALEGFSADVLQAAERQILKAKIPDLDPRFMPTPPQLAKLCDEIQASRHHAEMPKAEPLERFMRAPDPVIIVRFEKFQKEFAKVVDAHSLDNESRRDWLRRMSRDRRVKLLPQDVIAHAK